MAEEYDLLELLRAAAAHGSLVRVALPTSAGAAIHLRLVDPRDEQQLASFWLFGNVLVRYRFALAAPHEQHWVLSEDAARRMRALIAETPIQYNAG